MKRKLPSILILFIVVTYSFAQVPGSFNYQAVVRNNAGELIANQNVSFQISILQNSESGTTIYSETHSVITNDFGLANLKIGTGAVVSGVFSPGGWGVAPHFIKIELDPAGGSSYIHIGTSQLLAVPYAFHANTVENDAVDDADADPENELQELSISGTNLTLSNGGGTVPLPSSGGGDNWGTQSVVSDATLDGVGTTANPLSVVGDLTDDQTLSVSGNNLTISDGNTVALPAGEESLWDNSNVGIQYNSGKVGINHDPEDDTGMLQIWGENNLSIEAVNNSATYPTMYIQNQSGNAAYFDGSIKIADGTEGGGKILTSDEGGKAMWVEPTTSLWSENGTEIYFNNNVGIGISNPLFKLDVSNSTGETYARIQSGMSNAGLFIERAGSSDAASIMYKTGGGISFHTGLLSSSSYKISTTNPILNGLEVEFDGDVLLSDELHSTNTGAANMLPFAYGFIAENGTKNSSTPNVGTVSKSSTGQYKVEIPDLGSDYIVNVTPNHGIAYLTGVVSGRSSTFFIVAIWDTKNDAYKDGGFSFIVYKP